MRDKENDDQHSDRAQMVPVSLLWQETADIRRYSQMQWRVSQLSGMQERSED